YDPSVGRWTNPDPIRFSGGLNFFEYVQSDPENQTDPTGLALASKEFCERLAEKIKNVEKSIKKRISELDENPLELDETCPGDDKHPSLSRRGHRRLINEDKALLAKLSAEYMAFCTDNWGPPTPPMIPIPSPTPQQQGQGAANGTGTLGLILVVALAVLAL